MDRTIHEQAQELTQLHRTVGHLANLLEAWGAREDAQWLGMMTWMQESEQKSDTRHEVDKLCGADIMNMIAKTIKRVAQGQEGREREKERQRTVWTKGGGREATQHADPMREEDSEIGQQLQQQPQPTLQPKLQPKHQPAPNPMSTPTPARLWETIPPRAMSLRAPVGPVPAPMAGSSMAERGLMLRRAESVPVSNMMDQEIASAINRSLFHQQALANILIMNAKRNNKGAITAITY